MKPNQKGEQFVKETLAKPNWITFKNALQKDNYDLTLDYTIEDRKNRVIISDSNSKNIFTISVRDVTEFRFDLIIGKLEESISFYTNANSETYSDYIKYPQLLKDEDLKLDMINTEISIKQMTNLLSVIKELQASLVI